VAGIYDIKPAFQRSLRGIEGWLVERRVHPDWLTYLALALSVLGGVALYVGPREPAWLLLVPFVAIIRTALNALDGMVAVKTGLARPWGEVLNELCDRFADVALLGGMALVPGVNHLLGAASVVAVLLTSYLAILAKAAGGRRLHGGPMGKPDRMIVLAIGAPLGLVLPVPRLYDGLQTLILVGVLLTLVLRLRAAHADLDDALQPSR
jgi:CDP-diacylglycerol--glycerol-3-phosphate 3-phosphatidyltransferase